MPSQLHDPLRRRTTGKPFDLSTLYYRQTEHSKSLVRSAPRPDEVPDFINRRLDHSRRRENADIERVRALEKRPWSNDLSSVEERKAVEREAARVEKMFYHGLPYIPPPEEGVERDAGDGRGRKRKIVTAKRVERGSVVKVQNELEKEAFKKVKRKVEQGGYVGIEPVCIRPQRSGSTATPEATGNRE